MTGAVIAAAAGSGRAHRNKSNWNNSNQYGCDSDDDVVDDHGEGGRQSDIVTMLGRVPLGDGVAMLKKMLMLVTVTTKLKIRRMQVRNT